MSQGRHIFLSYRSTDADFALKLAASLKNAGVKLWMDRLDIRPGDDWRTALEAALNESAAMIAVLSPGYVMSEYCRRELARADRLGRKIFPVLLGQIPELALPIELERQQHIDFSNCQSDGDYQRQVDSLVSILTEKFASQISLAPDLETQYLTNLVAQLETHKGLTQYLEHATEADKWLDHEYIRPEPRFIKSWVESSNYTVVEYTPTIGDLTVLPVPGYKSYVRDIRAIFDEQPRFVVVGDSGSGKSATLHYLILEMVHQRQLDPQSAPLPLLLNPATWDDTMDLKDFLRASWPLDTDPIKLLAKGEIVLFMDALNEIATEQHQKVSMLRQWLASSKSPQRLVVACRRDAYRLDLNLGLPVVHIEPMCLPHIRQFVTNYLGQEIGSIFLNRILPTDGWAERHKFYLYQLARNPFLLSALILYHKSSPYGDVPENKGELLQLLTTQMWQRTCDEEPVASLPFEALETALAELALAMIEDNMGVYAPEDYALEHIGSQALLQAALQANFIEIRAGNVRFTYETQQAYFAALALAQVGVSTRLTPPAVDPGGRYIPGKWDQVITIHGCLSPTPDDKLLEIAQINPFLALTCITSGMNASAHIIDPIIGALLQVAHTPANDARVATANILAQIDHELAIPILLEAMREGRWEVRSAATLTLWELEYPTLEGLTGILQHPEHNSQEHVQDATAIAVRHLRADALPTLLKLLRSEDWKMRRSACWALAELKDQAATPALIQMLNDEVNMVSEEAAHALSQIRDEAAIPWLVEALQHSNRRIRRRAARALGNIGAPALDRLLEVLSQGDVNVRRLVIEAIREIRQPVAGKVLLKLSRDRSADVRAAALEALEDRIDEAVIQRLIACLADDAMARWNRTRICEIAAQILETIYTPEAQTALEEWYMKQIKNQSAAGQKQSAETAKERLKQLKAVRQQAEQQGQPTTLGPQQAKILDRLLANLRTTEWGARETAAKALREYTRTLNGSHTDRIVDQLTAILNDDDWLVRWAAAEALASVGNQKAVPALMKATQDDNWMVRIAVVRALTELGDKSAVQALGALVKDQNSLVREAVAEALGVLGKSKVIPALTTLLADPESFVRLAAMIGMSRASAKKAAHHAIDTLDDEDSHVRWAAAVILDQAGNTRAIPVLKRHLDDHDGPHWEDLRISDLAAQALQRIEATRSRAAQQPAQSAAAKSGG